MRKLILIIVALMFGVSVGVGSSQLLRRPLTPVLPYCEVAKNADAYHMKFVRVKATVHIFGDMTIYEDCDPDEALASWIEFDEDDRPAYLRELVISDPLQSKTAEAIVEGDFDAEHSMGCYGPKFRIIASKVTLISPIRDYVPPVSESTGPTLRLKH